jgi:glutamyl-tRNA synthetase
MGYPPSALRNYLARLGWSHGHDEVFTDAQAQGWFDLGGVNRAPSRLDFKKLDHLTGLHFSAMDDAALLHDLDGYLAATGAPALTDRQRAGLAGVLHLVKDRARNFGQIVEKAHFILAGRPLAPDPAAAAALDSVSRGILKELTPQLQTASWTRDGLEAIVTATAAAHGLGLGKLAQPLRAALAGRMVSPSVFDMMLALGRSEVLARLSDVAAAPAD